MAYKMKGFGGFGNSPAKNMKTGKYEHSFESPAKQKKNQQKVVGEQTGLVKTDKKGQKHVLQDYDTDYGMMEGDTLFIPPAHHASIIDDEYLMGGDYEAKETKDSEKRKKGPKSYTLK